MARRIPSPAQSAPESGYRVELPRKCDAMGTILRDAFERGSFEGDMGLPDDMLLLLRQMNGRPATSRDH